MSVLEVFSTRNVLFCTLAAVLCLSFAPASAQEPIATPILSSAPNFRDLAGISASNGGTGFADTTSNGGVMRTGIFYRSDALNSLSNADSATITSLRVGRDIDLRTTSEILSHPDIVPNGVIHTNINIYGGYSPVPEPPFSAPPAEAITFMRVGYRLFVIDPTQQEGFRNVLLTLANDPHPDLWHCSGGKDRTGWTANLLQSIAGVSSTTIMQDYLATNTYTAALIASTKAAIMAGDPTANPATIDALLGVESSYLQAGLDQVIATYGSMHAYLTEGLGLTQADIYVLRAKMVLYQTLPGQSGFAGNAASGAALLNALQNSPLSGHYTAFNYYLQSAVDTGTLGGVQTQVGGQIHADAASFLMRRPQWIDEAITPYTNGRDIGAGQTRVWMAGLGGTFSSDGGAGVAGSSEDTAGTIIGATYRLNSQTSANLGIGYNWGSVESAGATATLNTVLGTIGGRYGFSTLESGPYVVARADVGWVDYESKRVLGGGLGTARGNTNGALYSGLAGLGDVIRLDPFTITLQTGVRVTNVNLDSFNERGSDLALGVNGIDETSTSVLVDLDVSLDRRQLGAWTIAPAVTLGYERVLDNPRVTSTGTIFSFPVSQSSAFDSHDLVKGGLGITAQRGAFTIKTGVNGLVGTGSGSTGIGGQLSIGYSF